MTSSIKMSFGGKENPANSLLPANTACCIKIEALVENTPSLDPNRIHIMVFALFQFNQQVKFPQYSQVMEPKCLELAKISPSSFKIKCRIEISHGASDGRPLL
jgi:hypothetical protein